MGTEKRELRYGNNVEWFLNELAAYEPGDISYGSFEVYSEDAKGREGSCEIVIPDLSADAAQLISELRGQIAALTAENMALKDLARGWAIATDDRLFEQHGDVFHSAINDCEAELKTICSATDAAANALRAEGVEMYAASLKDKYEGIAYELIGNYETNGEEDRIADEGEIEEALHFANQLREGK